MFKNKGLIQFKIRKELVDNFMFFLTKNENKILGLVLSIISIATFMFYYKNGLGLAYNDARSHLDIARRVVEGLKPGVAQLGSVWLPLPHVLMALTIWNDFMWHSGLSGAVISMFSYVITGVLIKKYLEKINIGRFGQYIAVAIFALNLNILYLQSTAMTELLLIATMMLASYFLMEWARTKNTLDLIKCAFWTMLSTLIRYDGWFLLAWATFIVVVVVLTSDETRLSIKEFITSIKLRYQKTEGTLIMFLTLASFGIVLWLLWNLLIFKDPLYFAFGPYSAKAQQDQLELAGNLPSKHNIVLSTIIYIHAFMLNGYVTLAALGLLGILFIMLNKEYSIKLKLAISVLIAPLAFNIVALYFGHSVLFVQGLSGNTWFNIRYGVMMVPAFAIFTGYLVAKLKEVKWPLVGVIVFTIFFALFSRDAVTIDDARVGSSQKNVSEVSGWLRENAKDKDGFILISAASHDAIIFSSGLPMKRFIHEGTGLYWESATTLPDKWARWIIMRTYDDNDLTYKAIKDTEGFKLYDLVDSFPFADIYELKPQYVHSIQTREVFKNQK